MSVSVTDYVGKYDAIIAVSEAALNTQLDRIFKRKPGFSEVFDQIIDADFGKSINMKVDSPTAAITITPDRVKLQFRIKSGAYVGGILVNLKGEKIPQKTDLANKSLSFHVDISRMRRDHFYDSDFLVEELYADLTKITNIDTSDFGVAIDGEDSLSAILKGLLDKLQTSSNDPDSSRRLFLGAVTIPKLPSPGADPQPSAASPGPSFLSGPMRPTSAAFSTSPPANGKNGELDFLLMTGNHALPAARPAPAHCGDGSHDAVMVLSDYLLLDSALCNSLLKTQFPKAVFELTRGDATTPSRLELKGECPLDEGEYPNILTRCVGEVANDGTINLDLDVRHGTPMLGLGNIQLRAGRERSYSISFNLENGDLKPKVSAGQIKELKNDVKVTGSISTTDKLKLAAQMLVPIYGAVANAIQAVMTDFVGPESLEKSLSSFNLGAGVTPSIVLPGAPVFKFANIRGKDRQLFLDLDYIAIPGVREPQCKPYEIGEVPALTSLSVLPPAKTESKLIGEVVVPFRIVHDSLYEGSQATRMPYYVLSREQYWNCESSKSFTGDKTTETLEVEVETTKKTVRETTNTFKFEFAAEAELNAFESSLKLSTKFEQEFEDKKTSEKEVKNSTKQTIEVEHEKSKPYAVAVYSVADEYTLRRCDNGRTIVGQWIKKDPNRLYMVTSDGGKGKKVSGK